jgi:hypothetical protein
MPQLSWFCVRDEISSVKYREHINTNMDCLPVFVGVGSCGCGIVTEVSLNKFYVNINQIIRIINMFMLIIAKKARAFSCRVEGANGLNIF